MTEEDKWLPRRSVAMTGWFEKFAWFPVETVDRGFRWMTFVWCRRLKHSNLMGVESYLFQYRAIRPFEEINAEWRNWRETSRREEVELELELKKQTMLEKPNPYDESQYSPAYYERYKRSGTYGKD